MTKLVGLALGDQEPHYTTAAGIMRQKSVYPCSLEQKLWHLLTVQRAATHEGVFLQAMA